MIRKRKPLSILLPSTILEVQLKDISPRGSTYKAWRYLLFANMCLTSMSLQGAVTWLTMVTVKLLKTWKHESSSGDSLSILVSPKWFDRNKVPYPLQKLCDTIVISASNVLVASITTTPTSLFTKSPTKNSESLVRIDNTFHHNVQGVRMWRTQILGTSSLCSNHLEVFGYSVAGPACLTGTAC